MALLRVKAKVQPRIVWMIAAVARVAAALESPTSVWITSAMEGNHSRTSLHPALRAIDVRTKNFSSIRAKHAFLEALRAEFGDEYDILFEYVGKPHEHIHIEWDP